MRLEQILLNHILKLDGSVKSDNTKKYVQQFLQVDKVLVKLEIM